MRTQTVIDVDGEEVTIREPLIAEIRSWLAGIMASSKQGADGIVDDLLISGHTLKAIYLLTNLTQEDIGRFTPSQARKIVEACRESVPDFFAMMETLQNTARKLLVSNQTFGNSKAERLP